MPLITPMSAGLPAQRQMIGVCRLTLRDLTRDQPVPRFLSLVLDLFAKNILGQVPELHNNRIQRFWKRQRNGGRVRLFWPLREPLIQTVTCRENIYRIAVVHSLYNTGFCQL